MLRRSKLFCRRLLRTVDPYFLLAAAGVILYIIAVNSVAASMRLSIERSTASDLPLDAQLVAAARRSYPEKPINEMDVGRDALTHLRAALARLEELLPERDQDGVADLRAFLQSGVVGQTVPAPSLAQLKDGGSGAGKSLLSGQLVDSLRGRGVYASPALLAAAPWPFCLSASGGSSGAHCQPPYGRHAITAGSYTPPATAAGELEARLLLWLADQRSSASAREAYADAVHTFVLSAVRTYAAGNYTIVGHSGGFFLPLVHASDGCAVASVIAMGARLGAHEVDANAARELSRDGAIGLAEALAATCHRLFGAGNSGAPVLVDCDGGVTHGEGVDGGEGEAAARRALARMYTELYLLTLDPLYGAWMLELLARTPQALPSRPLAALASELRFAAYLFNAMECKTYPEGKRSHGLCLVTRKSTVITADGYLVGLLEGR